ncbi:MAG: ribonuclease H-like domain-containing protein [Gammaproteobacteria bacterium]
MVIDTGEEIIGIYSASNHTYTPYRGRRISLALKRIAKTSEVVTYNGKHYDLAQLGHFAGLPEGDEYPLNGTHTDMREIIWSERIWGKCLRDTYIEHFMQLPEFPSTYEGSNEADCYMTYMLWRLWKQGELKILDGQSVHA